MHIGVTLPSLGTRLWAFGYTPTFEFVLMLLQWNEQPDSLIAVHDTGLQTIWYICTDVQSTIDLSRLENPA